MSTDAKPKWVTVVVAASMMGVSERQARRRLKRIDADLEGRLLKPLGTKTMPSGAQASKYLVCLPVLREAMDHEHDASADIVELRAELSEVKRKLESLRKAVKPLLVRRAPRDV